MRPRSWERISPLTWPATIAGIWTYQIAAKEIKL